VATGVAAGGDLGPGVQEVAAMALSLMVNVLILLIIFALLTPPPHTLRELLPGVAVGRGDRTERIAVSFSEGDEPP